VGKCNVLSQLEKTIEQELEVVVYKKIEEKSKPQSQIVAPKPRHATISLMFTLEDVTIRLKTCHLMVATPHLL
jgi:hypothetical protein